MPSTTSSASIEPRFVTLTAYFTSGAEAAAAGVTGKAVTPFLLLRIVELSGGRSLEVNLDLARNNVRVAAEIAIAWAALR